MINKLTKDSILDEEVFDEIFSQEDEIYKARLTLTLLDRAKELGVKKKFEDSGKNMKLDGGIQIFSGEDKEALQNFFDKLADYGLFVVPNGELESWLTELSASGHGPNWLVEIFEKMGEDPTSENYLKPKDNDVWNFIDLISAWFLNPRRKGIPK